MPTRHLKPGRKYTHRQAFTIWLHNGPNRAAWLYWLDEQGFHRCEICKQVSDMVDLVCELRPKDGDILEEWFACANTGCDARLRELVGIDEDGYPVEVG